ncbi:MAG: flavin-containing monooxygenase, partial [Ruegeria sp.]
MIQNTDMLIVGAGFSGLTMAIEARRRGLKNITILEKAGDVGGTWRENTYPGVACDVPSHLYSMATHLNPDWSRAYAGGAEIQFYLQGVARDEGLYDLCNFHQKLESALWDGSRWQVETEDGHRWSTRFLVSAIGALHIPLIPQIPGADTFPGPAFHSAEWDHSADLS